MKIKKKIIDKKLYDPNTARHICSFKRVSEDDAPEEKIYRTKTGNYFVLRDKNIKPIDEATARMYVKTYIPERYDKIFSENEKIKRTFLLDPYTAELLEEIKIRDGVKKYSTIIDNAISFYYENSDDGKLVIPISVMESLKKLGESIIDMQTAYTTSLEEYNQLILEAQEKYRKFRTETLNKSNQK